MRSTRLLTAFVVCFVLGHAARPAFVAAPPGAATQPASAPAMAAELAEAWRAWRQAWSAARWEELTTAEGGLGAAIRGADRAGLQALVAEMQKQHEAAGDKREDAYRRVRLAYLIFTARVRLERLTKKPSPPSRPDEKSMRAFLDAYHHKNRTIAETGRWGFRLMEDAAGDMPDPQRKADALTRAFFVMPSVGFFCMPFVEDPRPLVPRFRKIRPVLAGFAAGAPPQQERDVRKHYQTVLRTFDEALELFVRRAEGRRAVRKLLGRYVAAYNGKDDAALIEVFGGSDADKAAAATQPSRRPTGRIAASRWTIDLLEAYAVYVSDDTASIELFVRYCDKAGEAGPIRQGTLRARKTSRGWRLED